MIFYFAEINDLRLKVTFEYRPGTPDVMYLPNGDPGYPGEPPELNIESVVIEKKVDNLWTDTGIDIYQWLYDDADETPLSRLSAAAIEHWENEEVKHLAEILDYRSSEDL
jgi:hypothetical protein